MCPRKTDGTLRRFLLRRFTSAPSPAELLAFNRRSRPRLRCTVDTFLVSLLIQPGSSFSLKSVKPDQKHRSLKAEGQTERET